MTVGGMGFIPERLLMMMMMMILGYPPYSTIGHENHSRTWACINHGVCRHACWYVMHAVMQSTHQSTLTPQRRPQQNHPTPPQSTSAPTPCPHHPPWPRSPTTMVVGSGGHYSPPTHLCRAGPMSCQGHARDTPSGLLLLLVALIP